MAWRPNVGLQLTLNLQALSHTNRVLAGPPPINNDLRHPAGTTVAMGAVQANHFHPQERTHRQTDTKQQTADHQHYQSSAVPPLPRCCEMTVQPAHLGCVPGISQLSKTRNLMNQLLFLGDPERSKNAYIYHSLLHHIVTYR